MSTETFTFREKILAGAIILGVLAVGAIIISVVIASMWACYYAGIPM